MVCRNAKQIRERYCNHLCKRGVKVKVMAPKELENVEMPSEYEQQVRKEIEQVLGNFDFNDDDFVIV